MSDEHRLWVALPPERLRHLPCHDSFIMHVAAPHSFFFFFNDTAPTEFYPLSLHDALPISVGEEPTDGEKSESPERPVVSLDAEGLPARVVAVPVPEARYSALRAVKGGLAWLREPVTEIGRAHV